jgi:preprotein translocase subunit SecA
MDIPVEIYDAVRELYPRAAPPFRARPFDVQLIGGMVLYEGKIAEMKTGEGKTIVAPLAAYLAVHRAVCRCHVVTVNDYLVQRDRDWTLPVLPRAGADGRRDPPEHSSPRTSSGRCTAATWCTARRASSASTTCATT